MRTDPCTVDLYRKVRLACRDGMSEQAASRYFGISRDSVKKILSFSVPPGYRRTAPIRRPKLDGFTEIIDEWLREDQGRNRKQRHTAKRVLDRLRDEHGFTGGYTIIKRGFWAPVQLNCRMISPSETAGALAATSGAFVLTHSRATSTRANSAG